MSYDPNMRLSSHFTLSEMIFSQTAVRHGIVNMPHNDGAIAALKSLCVHILEPVRTHYGVAITPSSGYRGAVLNKLIKGSRTSQHMVGEAVDFVVPGVSVPSVCDFIRQNLNYDQLIQEFYNPKTGSGWVHCSYRRAGGNRKEFMRIG